MDLKKYVSYDVADLLKKNGYNEPCIKFYCKMYDKILDCNINNLRFNYVTYKELEDGDILIPSLDDTLSWIREKYRRHITSIYWPSSLSDCGKDCWEGFIINMDNISENKFTNKEYQTLEEMLNAEIKELLKKNI